MSKSPPSSEDPEASKPPEDSGLLGMLRGAVGSEWIEAARGIGSGDAAFEAGMADGGCAVSPTPKRLAAVRLQIRCPHCHNPIEVVDDDPSGDVSCPSCGSCFNLAKDVETGRYLGSGRMLGHFQLLDRLGRGAFGEVWKARDTELDRTVAIKIPRREHLSEQETEQFLREARAAAQVRHPNIVSVYEIGRERGLIYIASDFIDGASLADWIDARPLSVRESVELCAKIAEALHHAHDAGIVHRDLKPQNILVRAEASVVSSPLSVVKTASPAAQLTTDNGQLIPFITDFGLAKRETGEITMTVEGAILGTPAYMSPEQARGEAHHADRRSDVYSLGVILFRLLTGELPFRGKSQMLMVQILNEEPPALRQLDARISRDLETICLKCLEKDPSRRYSSAADLASDLRRWLTGHSITARPVSRAERGWRWCKRNSTVAALSVLVTLVLLIGIAVSWFFAAQSSQRANEAEANLKLSDRRLYAADMNLVQLNWEATRVGSILDLLERHGPPPKHAPFRNDLRGFEWFYWHRLCHRDLLTLKGHTDLVWSVTFSPDGRRIVSASSDQTMKLWDAATGLETATLKGHTGAVHGVAFSPDGARIASASGDQTVRFWDTDTGQETATLKGHTGAVLGVAFSPDGARIASASGDQTVRLWDTATVQETATLKGHTGAVLGVAFSPDGARIASASADETMKLWDTAVSQEITTLKGHTGAVQSAAFSPDGARIASASRDGTVKLWDAATGQVTATLKGHTRAVQSVAFSPDGARIASASLDGTVRLWDAATGRMTGTLRGHTREVLNVAFSPDGARLVSASGYDGERGEVKLWDAISEQEATTLKGHTGAVQSAAFSPDGARIASASRDGTVKLWDAATGQETATLKGHAHGVQSVAFSPDGARIASASVDQTVKLWDAATGQETATLKGHTGAVHNIAFSPDGDRIASASGDQTVKVWDAATLEEIVTLKAHTLLVMSVAFSPDGLQIASAGNQTVKLWEMANGQMAATLNGHSGPVTSVAFSPDGKSIASASGDQTVRLWDAARGSKTATLNGHPRRSLNAALKGHTGRVSSIAFSSDGARIASASGDQTVKLWDAATGQEIATLKGHADGVNSVAFSPDGTRIASASSDQTVKVWDARPWTPEFRVEQRALGLVRFLFEHQKLPREQVLDRITHDRTLTPDQRRRALQFAREWRLTTQ